MRPDLTALHLPDVEVGGAEVGKEKDHGYGFNSMNTRSGVTEVTLKPSRS